MLKLLFTPEKLLPADVGFSLLGPQHLGMLVLLALWSAAVLLWFRRLRGTAGSCTTGYGIGDAGAGGAEGLCAGRDRGVFGRLPSAAPLLHCYVCVPLLLRAPQIRHLRSDPLQCLLSGGPVCPAVPGLDKLPDFALSEPPQLHLPYAAGAVFTGSGGNEPGTAWAPSCVEKYGVSCTCCTAGGGGGSAAAHKLYVFREAVTGFSAGAFDGVSGPRGLSDRLLFIGTGSDFSLEFMLCASYVDLEEKTKNGSIGMCTKG